MEELIKRNPNQFKHEPRDTADRKTKSLYVCPMIRLTIDMTIYWKGKQSSKISEKSCARIHQKLFFDFSTIVII